MGFVVWGLGIDGSLSFWPFVLVVANGFEISGLGFCQGSYGGEMI